jgi:predicted MFS family arabinose efflux permease
VTSPTIGDIFNPRERGQWMGVIVGVFGLASIIGPTLGGWITDAFGWRWVFYVNLPVAALVLLAVLYSLPRVRASRRVKLDWQGSILVAAGLLPLLLAFTWAGSRYPWTSPVIIGLVALGLVLLILFVINERRAEEPILDPALLGNRLFAMTLLIALLVTMSMFGVLMFLPLFLQGVMGMSAREAGLALIPLTLSFVIGSIASGQIMTRSGRYKALAVVAALLVVLGLIGFLGMDTATTVTTVVRNMVVFGVGIGMLLPPMNVVAQNVFPYRIMGMVSATQQFVRSLGGVIVAPILGAVLTQGFTGEFERLLPGSVREAIARFPAEERQALLDPQNLTNAQAQEALQDRFALLGAEGEALYGQFLQVVQGALASGIHDLFVIALVFGIATLVGTFFLEEIRLKREDFFEGDEPSRQSEGNTGQDAMDE